jgi:hypothetical protein
MEQLTAEHGAQRVRLMLEANPRFTEELAGSDLLTYFLKNATPSEHGAPMGIDPVNGRKLNENPSGRA